MCKKKCTFAQIFMESIMKRVILFACLLVPTLLLAGVRTSEEAAEIAAQFVNAGVSNIPMRQGGSSVSDMSLAYRCDKLQSAEPAFYVFNHVGGGYVVVSGDDVSEEVLMYNETGTFDMEAANSNLRFWLRRMQEEMSVITEENALKSTAAVSEIKPLLTDKDGKEIEWSQEYPYNLLCPIDKFDDTRSYSGCVATAAAQIMCRWRHPEKGVGYKDYYWINDHKSSQKMHLIADYAHTTYDWNNMSATYNGTQTPEQDTAVATLMFHCGIACNMKYGGVADGGSGAFTDEMAAGMTTYFDYAIGKLVSTTTKAKYAGSRDVTIPAEWSVSSDKMEQYFNRELEAGRPILMDGQDKEGGHAFVCDGRNKEGKFHINWGWGGDGNCYCLLTSLKVVLHGSPCDYTTNMSAIIGIMPKYMSAVEEVRGESEDGVGRKVLRNGRIMIERAGVRYNVLGQKE